MISKSTLKFMTSGRLSEKLDWPKPLNVFREFLSIMSEREEWLGAQVSLDCGSLGYFQGVISRINYSDQTVTLEKPFQNGLACKFPEITINSTDINVRISRAD